MPFFTFRQNNSHGIFKGPRYVIVEAKDADTANFLAEGQSSIPVYFDGCASGIDCSCCGDRWDKVRKDDATETIKIYAREINFFDVDELIKKDPKLVLDLFSFEKGEIQIFFTSAPSISLHFTSEHLKKAKALVLAARKTVWAFNYHYTWTLPSEVFKAYEQEYDTTRYYDSTGNYGVDVIEGRTYVTKDAILSASFSNKEEAEAARQELVELLESISTEANKIISKSTIPKSVLRVIKKRYPKAKK